MGKSSQLDIDNYIYSGCRPVYSSEILEKGKMITVNVNITHPNLKSFSDAKNNDRC